MGLIGDIYYAFRGDGARLQKDAQVEGAKAGTTLGSSMAAGLKKSWSGGEIGKGLVQGLGLAGGLGAFSLVSGAISKVTDILGEATAAAIEEEASIHKLGTALKANIPNWDGETAGIEKVLQARMALGFSDDEQRNSLATLVAATHDVNKALEIQRTAMDLARFKGISLADATDALTKVEAGSYRILKSLGIQLPKNATQTEALAAVQRVANGQAEDYAKTNAGKLLVSQVKVGEAMEKLGAVTMPVVVEVMTTAADIATQLADAFAGIGGSAKSNEDPLQNFANLVHDAFKPPGEGSLTFFGWVVDGLNGLQRNLTDSGIAIHDWLTFWDGSDEAQHKAAAAADHTGDSIEAMRSRVGDALGAVTVATDTVGEHAGAMADDVVTANDKAASSWEDLKKALIADANELIDNAFDPTIEADRLAATNAELAAARRVLASSKSSKAEIADARATLHSASKDQAEHLLKLAEAGATTSKAYATGIKDLKTAIKNAKGPAKAALQEILNKIREIEREGKIHIQVTANLATAGNKERAIGGPVLRNVPYWVGERGPEIHVPETNGRILTTAQSMAAVAAGASAGAGSTFNVMLPTTARPDPFETADALRRLNDFGVLQVPA